MAEQYFSADPSSKDVRRTMHVTLRGHEADVQVSNGVFSANRVDLGTSVLLRQAPEPPLTGEFLDLGCGWGPVALALSFESPEATVWAVDVNERALDLTHANAQANGRANIRTALTDESGAPLPDDAQPAFASTMPGDLTFDTIWSNPPIRIGKEALHTLLMTWLPRLRKGGAAYLVVQRNLGSDSLIPWLDEALGDDFTVGKYASSKGFRIIEIRHEI
ncbi:MULTISPECIES: class I SAM-dependent methyltransferase [Bifidobacterium]|uniref:MFS transporter n=1 Tax=Bifidobacterium myosotis TaxID=1630166 RepID=A0A261FF08_9BIFI|nr:MULTISPECIES: methyltransferase [Bifidobacterium]KAA8827795.1 methyltransferase domain-containing protein [Bifidobacterium myosotis]OZG57729.1 MFS transporter [Bifidobacterium myosotis]TPF93199.1 MFS transporter [Bifidobacterium sp. UTBIF-78]